MYRTLFNIIFIKFYKLTLNYFQIDRISILFCRFVFESTFLTQKTLIRKDLKSTPQV